MKNAKIKKSCFKIKLSWLMAETVSAMSQLSLILKHDFLA